MGQSQFAPVIDGVTLLEHPVLSAQQGKVAPGVQARGGDAAGCYYMPKPSDRCIVALRKWIDTHAPAGIAGLRPLPPAIYSRDVLFDRWTQHTSHCKHCERSATSCHATSPTASRPRPCLACRATSCAVRPLSKKPTRHHPQSPLVPLAFDAGRRPSGGGLLLTRCT